MTDPAKTEAVKADEARLSALPVWDNATARTYYDVRGIKSYSPIVANRATVIAHGNAARIEGWTDTGDSRGALVALRPTLDPVPNMGIYDRPADRVHVEALEAEARALDDDAALEAWVEEARLLWQDRNDVAWMEAQRRKSGPGGWIAPAQTFDERHLAAVIEKVRGYAAETQHGAAHVHRWERVLASLGVANGAAPMLYAECVANRDRFSRSRWQAVCEIVEERQAAGKIAVRA